MATELNFVAALGTDRAAPMWILSPIGWSGHIEKRLPAEYLSLLSNAARRIYPGFSYDFLKFEDPLWSALSSQPMSLLDHKYENWNALFLSAVDTVIEKIKAQKDGYSQRRFNSPVNSPV